MFGALFWGAAWRGRYLLRIPGDQIGWPDAQSCDALPIDVHPKTLWHNANRKRFEGTESDASSNATASVLLTCESGSMGERERSDVEGDLASRVAKLFGFATARVAVEFCKKFSNRALDPFAGYGTTLHVAEELGMDSVGVDIDAACCEACEVAKKFDR